MPDLMVHAFPHTTREMTAGHKTFSNSLFCLMQLRLGVAYGAMQDLCDLSMTIAIKLVQLKNCSISEGECFESTFECYPVERVLQAFVMSAKFTSSRARISATIKRGLESCSLPKMHEGSVDGNAVQPSRECGFPSKRVQLTKRLDECFLGQVIRVSGIVCHPETNGVDAASMKIK